MADVVIKAAKKGEDPQFDITVRAMSNVEFNQRKWNNEMGNNTTARTFFNLGMAKKFMQTMLVADALKVLQQDDISSSLREIYYRTKHTIADSNENTFDDQDESDPIIEDLEVTLALLREELHVRAAEAGSIVGPVTLVEGGDVIDCSKQGKAGKTVPSIVEPGEVDIKKVAADVILLIEKGTQFNRLSEDKFRKKHNYIQLTGNSHAARR